MSTPENHLWNPQLLTNSHIYWPLLPLAEEFMASHAHWPNLNDYQNFLEQGQSRIYSDAGAALHFVPQGKKPSTVDATYEPRIYLKGEIQTRLRNWHDFFQVLVWKIFPNTKITLNRLHYHALVARHNMLQINQQSPTKTPSQRSHMENALTQFDECGAIILSSNKTLLHLIQNFKWKTLFWEHRSELSADLKCIVFGHAIYEKAIKPYLGLTAHSLLLHVDKNILQQPALKLTRIADQLINKQFNQVNNITSPQRFSPFPLLGMPGWLPENNQPDFYNNIRYFRSGRRTKK
ncbi:MAG: DUF3025 domain-containing protein [Gammaproteobacteria bacterium]|nr:DUF3025 domain-containing protein [Gammaproteobacteria bacterium]